MMLDTESFLDPRDFEELVGLVPTEGWRDAVVYDKTHKKERKAPESRQSLKCAERRDAVLRRVCSVVMPRVLCWLRKQEGFLHCWFRYSHTEWMVYREGMFFKEHKDFEKYICNHLVPYVGILGLEDTKAGGETVVEGTPMKGSTRRNGFVFFPGTATHSAATVSAGEKRCLKMEFFVMLRNDNLVAVADENRRWKSFWSRKDLALVDNYIASHSRFEKDGREVVTSTEMAKRIHDIMLSISDPRHQRMSAHKMDMVFPSYSSACLHDLFVCAEFLRGGSKGVLLGSDPDAWAFLQNMTSMPPNCTTMAALWYRNDKDGNKYRLGYLCPRYGSTSGPEKTEYTKLWTEPSPYDPWPCDERARASSCFASYTSLQKLLLQHFIADHDFEQRHPPFDLEMTAGHTHPETTGTFFKRVAAIQPSDRTEKPRRVYGVVENSSIELCNDEGYTETETYTAYESYRLQTRWCLVRL